MINLKLKDLNRSEIYENYTTEIEIWGRKNTELIVEFHEYYISKSQEKYLLKEFLEEINRKLNFINENKKVIGQEIIDDNILSSTDETGEFLEKKPFKGKKGKDFLIQLENFVKTKLLKNKVDKKIIYTDRESRNITFPITKENFFDSLIIEEVNIYLDDEGPSFVLKIRCIPDYFDNYVLNFAFSEEDDMQVINFNSPYFKEEEFDYDNLDLESLIDCSDLEDLEEYDDLYFDDFEEQLGRDLQNTIFDGMACQKICNDFIEAINNHNVKEAAYLLEGKFRYININGEEKNKSEFKRELVEKFNLFPKYKLKVLNQGLGTDRDMHMKVTIEADEEELVALIFELSEKKIKSLEVFGKIKR